MQIKKEHRYQIWQFATAIGIGALTTAAGISRDNISALIAVGIAMWCIALLASHKGE